MERKVTKEEINEARHQGTSIYGINYGYCKVVDCCDDCNPKIRLWCKIINIIENHKTKIIKKICKKEK